MTLESEQPPADGSRLPAAVAAALREPSPGTRRSADAPDRRWSILEWGNTTDEPLLLIHGVTSSARTWWRVGPALAAAGFRALAPDLPGHGLTGQWRGRYRFADTAAEVATLMNTLDLPIDAHVVGHSWGAMIAAELPGAGVRPRRLVLLDPPVLLKADLEAMVANPSDSTYPDLETATFAVRAANPTWSEHDVHWKAEALTQLEEAAARDVLLLNGEFDAGLAAIESRSADDVETWIVRGDPGYGGLTSDDAFARLARRVGSRHALTIAEGEHSPHRVLPEATTAALLRALGRG